MIEPRLADYLGHIEQACMDALAFINDCSEANFATDRRTQQAVLMNFIVIGEAATRIVASNPAFVRSHDNVPWQQMRGMRNRMAHGYFDIDMKAVWNTLQTDIPHLLAQIRELRKAI